jgi:hypothetical protein
VAADVQTRPESAVATRGDSDVATVNPDVVVADAIKSVARIDGSGHTDLVRIAIRVPLAPYYQYQIRGPGRKIGPGQDDWANPYTVGIRAAGYLFLNKVAGIQLELPDVVPDENGKLVRNPIHRDEKIYLRQVGIGYSDMGQLTSYSADVELDFRQIWEAERLKKKSAKVKIGEDGLPAMGPHGLPIVTLDQDDEKVALLSWYGLTTIREYEGREEPLTTQYVTIVAWRDKLTPDERLARARATSEAVFGAPAHLGDPDVVAREDELSGASEAEEGEFIEATDPDAVSPTVTVLPGEHIAEKAAPDPTRKLCGIRYADEQGEGTCGREPGHNGGHAPF